jgi:hypothetical protein
MLFGVIGNFDKTFQAIFINKFVDQVFVVLLIYDRNAFNKFEIAKIKLIFKESLPEIIV